MTSPPRFTSAMLELMPDDGKRYEVIDGELYVSKQPSWQHQDVGGVAYRALFDWSDENDAGRPFFAPGIIFADDDDVAPDLVWVSRARLGIVRGPGPHFLVAPDLVVEVLSPGATNERRDREAKVALYDRRGVAEYWIVNWQRRMVEVYRRVGMPLRIVATLFGPDTLTSPLLPGFALPLEKLFAGITAD